MRLLGVGRAAALVVLAAGINGTVAAFAPGYDGTYLSVGAVAVIACLEGSFIGVLAAIAAMLLEKLVGGTPFTLASAIAYASAIVIATAGRFLLRHPMTRTQPMPEGEAAILIERLQSELSSARTEAEAHRDAATADLEQRQKSWSGERDKLERSRNDAVTAADHLRADLQKARHEAEQARIAAHDREQELAAALAGERARAEAESEKEKSDRAAEAQKTGDALEAVSRQLESVSGQLVATQSDLANVRNEHSANLGELDEARKQLAARVADLEQLRMEKVAAERKVTAVAQKASARIRELEEQLAQLGPELHAAREAAAGAMRQIESDAQTSREREERLLAQYEEENAAMQRQLEAATESLRGLIAERDEAASQMAKQIESLQAAAAERAADAERNAGQAKEASERVTTVERDLAAALEAVTTLRAERDQARAEAAREVESFRTMLAERAADVTRNAEQKKEALERLATAQRELRQSQERFDELQQRFEAETHRVAEAASAAQGQDEARKGLEERLAAAEERAAAAHAQVEEMRGDINFARIQSVEEKKALEAEWSEKLNRIVSNLASDHENDLGDAVAQREAAKAESRQSAAKLQEALRALEEERSRPQAGPADQHELEEARAEVRELRMKLHEVQQAFDESARTASAMNHELRAARAAAEEEKAKREKLDVEWSEKLQSIVTHLASDHEADIGQATIDKEAAKAEARSLSTRVAALQQQIENEREVFRNAQQKWTTVRDSLLEKMQKAEDRWRKALEQQKREHRAEIETLKTSERPMTTEEIAAIRGESFAPPSVEATQPMAAFVEPPPPPVPAPEPPRPAARQTPVILIVLHNPALRLMTQHALSADGYTVLTAADGAEGLRMAMSHKPDIVVADSAMPKMDGRELCQAIKQNAETAATKVVLMSAMYTNDMPSTETAKETPPDEILQKPVKPEVLKASVSGLLALGVGH